MFEITFLTSNNIKLAHARYLCRDYDIIVNKQRHYGMSYTELRLFDRRQLLQASINDALYRLGKYSNTDEIFFFLEDTSVIIDVFSTKEEFPGVDVKYWMQKTTFESLDRKLKENGNNRSAKVRSDLVLVFPNKFKSLFGENLRYKIFTSILNGKIVEKEKEFNTQPVYSWLDNKSFNKWFVPEGCDTVVSLLPIDEAEKYDFRKSSFQQMLNLLEKNNLVKRRNQKDDSEQKLKMQFIQGSLFAPPYLFIVCGYTCAGKTTLAEYITNNYNYYHFEASDYMYLSYYQTHGVTSNVSITDFAEKALKDYPSIVVDQIINDIAEISNMPIIITGFRSPKEIESFKRQYRGDSQIKILFIDTDPEIRYQRCIERSRFDKHKDKKHFYNNDKQQKNMGLEEIRNQLTDESIPNNSTFDEYYNNFENLYGENTSIIKNDLGTSIKNNILRGLEEEIILSLYNEAETEQYYTTTEISKLVNILFHENNSAKSKNNVSRYFNQYFYPYYEIKVVNGKRKYRLSQTGIGHAKMILRLKH